MDDKIKLLQQKFGEHRIKRNEPLSYHVFSKLGGPAEIFFIATSVKELINILDTADDLQIPFFVLGNGTKTLVSPQGMRGLIIKNRASDLKIGAVKGKVGREGIGVSEAIVEVDSGVSLGRLNEFLLSQKLQPLADVSPNATIGGALWLSPVLIESTQKLIVWEKGEVIDIPISKLKNGDHVILSAVLKIKAV